MPDVDLPATLDRLKAAASAQVAARPQPRDRFAGYRLVRVVREVKAPKGLAFARGEYALAVERDPEPHRVRCERFITVWSRRSESDVGVRASDVEWLL